MRLRITASRPAIVRRSPDSIASPSVSKLRSSGNLILALVASNNLRSRCSVTQALFRLFRLASSSSKSFRIASGVTLTEKCANEHICCQEPEAKDSSRVNHLTRDSFIGDAEFTSLKLGRISDVQPLYLC